MGMELKQLTEKVIKIDFSKMQRCYERFSYLYDCEMQAQKYDAKLVALQEDAEDMLLNWVEHILAFQSEYKPNADVLSYMKEAKRFEPLLQMVNFECDDRARTFDVRYQKINALPRGAQLIADGKAFIADWRKQPAPVAGYCKKVTPQLVLELEKKLGGEAVCLGAEEAIDKLSKSRVKGDNSADWCKLVEGLAGLYGASSLKACRNYALYTELVEDAVFSRKVIRCKEYISALESGWNFEKVYALNETISAYRDDLRIVVKNFDQKWNDRLEEAKDVAKMQTEKWLQEGLQKQNTPEGFALFQKSAKYGNVKALAEIGYSYNFARGVEQNFDLAVKYIEQAIDAGLQEGYYFYLLGFRYTHTKGEKKPQKAFELYKRGENVHGSKWCLFGLAYCYLEGSGTTKNDKLAYEYFLKYFDADPNASADAFYQAGRLKETSTAVGIDEKQALIWYEKAEAKSHEEGKKCATRLREKFARCKEILSLIESAENKSQTIDFERAYDWDAKMNSYRGEFASQISGFDSKWRACMDFAKTVATKCAEEWFNQAYADKDDVRRFNLMVKSAKYGNVKACGEVGYYYSHGVGVTQNQSLCVEYLTKAIQGGLQDGYMYYLLGRKYEEGNGTAMDVKRAFDLYKKGDTMSYRGNTCQHALAYCYLNGVGTPKNPKLAYDYFIKYISWYTHPSWLKDCFYQLGRLKEYSAEVGKDEREALKWYEKAEQLGYTEGAKNATRLRNKFKKIELDGRIDVCYELAMKGDVNAMDELGEYYYTGNGVTRSYTDAVEWFEKAAKKGNAHAIERLGDCYYNGHGVKQSYAKAEKLYKQASKKA